MRRRPSDLDALREQLAQAISARDAAEAEVERAEKARDDLDGLSAEEWQAAEAGLAFARSEKDRLERVVTYSYAVAADEAERLAREPVAQAEREVEKIDLRIAEHEAALAKLQADHERATERLEDASEVLREARVPFFDPKSSEFKVHAESQRQRREVLGWHARHSGSDDQLGRRELRLVREIRVSLRAEAEQEHERFVEAARISGALVSDSLDERGGIECIERR